MSPLPQETVSLRNALLAEGRCLMALRPDCHATLNDLTAAVMIGKMLEQDFDVSIEQLEACIYRMRVAVETGEYPHQLLQEAEAL